MVAPEMPEWAKWKELEDLRVKKYIERLLSDARQDLAAQQSSLSQEERLKLEDEVDKLKI